jgi:ribosomal protein S6
MPTLSGLLDAPPDTHLSRALKILTDVIRHLSHIVFLFSFFVHLIITHLSRALKILTDVIRNLSHIVFLFDVFVYLIITHLSRALKILTDVIRHLLQIVFYLIFLFIQLLRTFLALSRF